MSRRKSAREVTLGVGRALTEGQHTLNPRTQTLNPKWRARSKYARDVPKLAEKDPKESMVKDDKSATHTLRGAVHLCADSSALRRHQ